MKVIHYQIGQGSVNHIINENPDCKFFHIKHVEKFRNESDSIITLARKDPKALVVLRNLTNAGFYLYMVKNKEISSFVKHEYLPELWEPIKRKDYEYKNGLIYSLTKPKVNQNVKLLVIFSSISGKMYQPSIHRYFEQNFKSIDKYISPNTAILRIADIGGVTGAYYLNTNFLKNNELKIQNLIFDTKKMLNTSKVVLFGISKGGTGAFYHGNFGNYDFLAVDPVLDDEHYLNKYKDLHFVTEIFPIPKVEKIKKILSCSTYDINKSGCVITSTSSPQFKYIDQIVIKPFGDKFNLFISNHPDIKDHPDVAPNCLHMITSIINNLLNEISYSKKTYNFI